MRVEERNPLLREFRRRILRELRLLPLVSSASNVADTVCHAVPTVGCAFHRIFQPRLGSATAQLSFPVPATRRTCSETV